MKKIMEILVIAGFLLGACALAYAIHEVRPAETQITLPGADGNALYEYIVKADPYKKWELWPGKGRFYHGREPHGSLLITYLNDSAHYSAKRQKPMSDGAIIVKENYSADKRLVAITVMYKIMGYNPKAGDWFWAKYVPDGTIERSGKVKGCIDCHSANKDNDYIFSGSVNKK
jgi:hypothetical protein